MGEKHMDMRVKRTLKSVQEAFYGLAQEMSLDQITITNLTQRASINRKTFYLHYKSMDDLLETVSEESYNNIMEALKPNIVAGNVESCIRTFFQYLNNCTGIQRILLCDPKNQAFCHQVIGRVLHSDIFQTLYQKTPFPSLTESYMTSLATIYQTWLIEKPINIEELIQYTTALINGGFKAAEHMELPEPRH